MKIERTARPAMAPRRRNWMAGCFLLLLALVPPARAGEQYTVEDCKNALSHSERDAVAVCKAAHAREPSRDALYYLAYAYAYATVSETQTDDWIKARFLAAEGLAWQLVAQGDAFRGNWLLCVIGSDENNLTGQADDALTRGMTAYRVAGSSPDSARAASCVARAALVAGRYHQAEKFAEIALQTLKEDRYVAGVAITLADALRRLGRTTDAQKVLNNSQVTDGCWRALLSLKAGMALDEALDQDSRDMAPDRYQEAEDSLTQCKRDNEKKKYHKSLTINRASRIALKDPDEANKLLDSLSSDTQQNHDAIFFRTIALVNRDLPAARLHLSRLQADSTIDVEWQWEDAQLRGIVAMRSDDLEDAEDFFRTAAEHVQKLRNASSSRAAYLLANHRSPFEYLISLYAQQGNWKAALKVVLELDASDMLRADANASDSTAQPKAVTDEDVDQVTAAWKGRELAVLIAPTPWRSFDDQPLVRLEILDGTVNGQLFENAAEALRDARKLSSDASDRNKEAAHRLGQLFVPLQAQKRSTTLDVLAIGELSKAPLAALGDNDQLMIASRPLARVQAVRGKSGPSEPATDPVALYANPDWDLPHVLLEAHMVASLVGKPAIASVAKKETLQSAKRATLLHLAAHLLDDANGVPALRLEDGNLSIAQVRELGLAPELAVLMTCRSRDGGDPEGWDSLAAALLSTGTQAVLANDHSVDDLAALTVSLLFYSQRNWHSDPARALAQAQLFLAKQGVDAARWAHVSILRAPPPLPTQGVRSPARGS